MLKIFLQLLNKAEAVLISDVSGIVPNSRRLQVTTADATGESLNEVAHLTSYHGTPALSIKLTEEGIAGGCFHAKTKEFKVTDSEGDSIMLRLLVNGEALVPPPGFEPEDVPVFIVIQEGGSSAELYAHAFNTNTDAENYRRVASDEWGYRTTAPVPVPSSLADHPAFLEMTEALVQAAAYSFK